MARVRNEERTLKESLESLWLLQEFGVHVSVVIVLHLCTDASAAIAEDFKTACQSKNISVDIHEYMRPVSRAGIETFVTDERSPHSFVTYSNACLENVRDKWMFKWDADFIMTASVAKAISEELSKDMSARCINICSVFRDGSQAATEAFMSNCTLEYKKNCFWEVPFFPHECTFVTWPQDCFFIHNDERTSPAKDYWAETAWYFHSDCEEAAILRKRHTTVMNDFIKKPIDQDIARACNEMSIPVLDILKHITLEQLDAVADADVTVVITSCNRPHLLRKTLESFVKFNTYKRVKCILIDDSGHSGVNDFARELCPFAVTLIYNHANLGQVESIDIAYSQCNTKWIFHCEEDWEFIQPGFIEKSMSILETHPKMLTVWLRPHDCTSNHPIDFSSGDDDHYLMKHDFSYSVHDDVFTWCGFTFNPGLRLRASCVAFQPYTQWLDKSRKNWHGRGEYEINRVYADAGYYAGILSDPKGHVTHIGWGEHVTRSWESRESDMTGYSRVFDTSVDVFQRTNVSFDDFRSNHNVFGFIDNGDTPPDNEAIAIAKSIDVDLYERYRAQKKAVIGYGDKVPMYEYSNLDSRHIMMSVHLAHYLPAVTSVVEIGGGFANWLRLNTGILQFETWTIIDLKHLNALQEWALAKNALACHFVDSDSYKIWADTASIDLVIGTHSLSEFSLAVFTDYFDAVVSKAKYFYYAYHIVRPNPDLIRIKKDMIEQRFHLIHSMVSENGEVVNCLYAR